MGAEQLRICNDDDGAMFLVCGLKMDWKNEACRNQKIFEMKPPPMHNTNLADTSIAKNLELALEGWFAHYQIVSKYFDILFNAHYSSQTFTPEGIFYSLPQRIDPQIFERDLLVLGLFFDKNK